MPIVGFHYDPRDLDLIYYEPPPSRPKELRRIRALLLLALVFSLVSGWQTANFSVQTYDTASLISERADELVGQEGKINRQIQENGIATVRAYAKAQGLDPPPADELHEQNYPQMGLDSIKMFTSLTRMLMFVCIALVVWFPIRYTILFRGCGRGHPETYRKIVTTARTQLVFELGRFLIIWRMNTRAEILEIPNQPSFSLGVAVLLLLFLRREDVREFFSEYGIRRFPPELVRVVEQLDWVPPGQAGPPNAIRVPDLTPSSLAEPSGPPGSPPPPTGPSATAPPPASLAPAPLAANPPAPAALPASPPAPAPLPAQPPAPLPAPAVHTNPPPAPPPPPRAPHQTTPPAPPPPPPPPPG
jgi:hypothetical protein